VRVTPRTQNENKRHPSSLHNFLSYPLSLLCSLFPLIFLLHTSFILESILEFDHTSRGVRDHFKSAQNLKQSKFLFDLKISCFMLFLEVLSSILVGTVEKSVYPNLIKIILKFRFVWIYCSRSLKIELMSLSGLEKLFSVIIISGKGS